jgi:hypothetical protein
MQKTTPSFSSFSPVMPDRRDGRLCHQHLGFHDVAEVNSFHDVEANSKPEQGLHPRTSRRSMTDDDGRCGTRTCLLGDHVSACYSNSSWPVPLPWGWNRPRCCHHRCWGGFWILTQFTAATSSSAVVLRQLASQDATHGRRRHGPTHHCCGAESLCEEKDGKGRATATGEELEVEENQWRGSVVELDFFFCYTSSEAVTQPVEVGPAPPLWLEATKPDVKRCWNIGTALCRPSTIQIASKGIIDKRHCRCQSFTSAVSKEYVA